LTFPECRVARSSRAMTREGRRARGASLRIQFQIADTASRSRGMICPSFAGNFLTLSSRGRREDRVRAAPAVVCNKCTRKRTRAYRFSGNTRPSCAMVLRLTRAPRRSGLLSPSPADLTPPTKPTSGVQDHTASLHAGGTPSLHARVHHPLTSVTFAKRPLRTGPMQYSCFYHCLRIFGIRN
jgi:hypothetical protein